MADRYEAARLDALHRLNLLDTSPSEAFDRITRLASQIFGLPVAAVSLTDHDRQWFKSRVGVEHQSIPRDKAPCAAVAESSAPLVVPDLLSDSHYATSILAGQGVRFYAGAPLTTRDGFGLGALCVLGPEPRSATDAEMASLNDLAQMVMTQIELTHAMGRIDPLSGLPNRTQFLEDLEDLARDTPGTRRLAVLVDLARADQLDNGARALGSAYIDTLVQEGARVLRAKLGPKRTAYHVALTKFVFLAPRNVDDIEYRAPLESLLRRLSKGPDTKFGLNGMIGVAPFIVGESAPNDVLRLAYSASLDACNHEPAISFYSSAEDTAHRRRFTLLEDFGVALEAPAQLRLVYQPRIDLASRRCLGAEALLRWDHPTLGEVSPAEFIPIVEQTSLARPTTAKVLDAGLAQLAAWLGSGIAIRLSINVSAANLDEADFAQRLQLYLLKHQVPPETFEIELTESAVMENKARSLAQLAAIEAAGIAIAIDDFGTGHSSLAYLQQLPAKVVKIDQSFVRRLTEGERERTLVRSMISLSHDLGYRVVAEGVETAEAADVLFDTGCDEAQGYFFARPMEVGEFERWYARQDAARAAA
ncbi:GGDEF and EAL domain-containing protein [Sphingomonas sp. S1-29]|uniref:putative bifunctional diguanylate cyclase/phosphodiesterase n=1 Tax=Sphingomonas sp. S1-29 TaxID=2991074 RepID=UPI0022407232|nr:GGDEF and EAL domain-containing protein [Sphingomonas sp. S1-29]UZK69519.1 GGDEF and EAL domain-containing protein [Sphingomonas sp. S1-29]